MTRRQLHPGDTVEVDVRGLRFPARIRSLADELIPGKPVHVEPLAAGVNYTRLSPRQIVTRLARGSEQTELAT